MWGPVTARIVRRIDNVNTYPTVICCSSSDLRYNLLNTCCSKYNLTCGGLPRVPADLLRLGKMGVHECIHARKFTNEYAWIFRSGCPWLPTNPSRHSREHTQIWTCVTCCSCHRRFLCVVVVSFLETCSFSLTSPPHTATADESLLLYRT